MEKKRPNRTPIRGGRDILAVQNQDPNYVYRWVNDTTGRIERFKAAGYEPVTADVEVGTKAVDRNSKLGSVITRSVGGTITAVLMRIPKEWYDEDQAAKQAQIDESDRMLRSDQDVDYGILKVNRK